MIKASAGEPKHVSETVTVTDQFGTIQVQTKKVERLLVPTNKRCYQVKASKGQPKHQKVSGQIHTFTQFGPEQLDTIKERHLCVPAVKTP